MWVTYSREEDERFKGGRGTRYFKAGGPSSRTDNATCANCIGDRGVGAGGKSI